MSVGFYITFIGLLTRRYIEQTPEQHPGERGQGPRGRGRMGELGCRRAEREDMEEGRHRGKAWGRRAKREGQGEMSEGGRRAGKEGQEEGGQGGSGMGEEEREEMPEGRKSGWVPGE